MGNNQNVVPKKVVRLMEPTVTLKSEQVKAKYRRTRVVAYCRVSTKEEEQLNSYENQLNYYTEKINEGKIVYDVSGEEKKNLTVEDLMKKFSEVGGHFSDRAILG